MLTTFSGGILTFCDHNTLVLLALFSTENKTGAKIVEYV